MKNLEDLVFVDDSLDDIDVSNQPWNLLIVDDESDIHTATKLVLNDVKYKGKKVNFINAYSGEMAKEILKENNDIAVILLDVIMESNDSGLKLVKYIRKELRNNFVRIILRTGQPGDYPEEKVIVDYDINDYKSKLELTSTKLATSVISALRSYNDLVEIQKLNENIFYLKKYLESIIDTMPSMIISTDTNGIIKNWNSYTEKITGITKHSAIGENLFSVLECFNILKNDFNEVVNTNQYFFSEKIEINMGKSKFFKVMIFKIEDSEFSGIVLNLSDITEIELIEEKLKFSQKMELVGTLSSGLAHDINNAIMSITAPISLLKYKLHDIIPKNDNEIPSLLEIIDLGTSHMTGIVSQMQSLTKKKQNTFEMINLNELLKMLNKICRYKIDHSVKVIMDFYKEDAFIYGDMIQLQEVFINLCINAEHAMTIMRNDENNKGGIINISIAKEVVNRVEVKFIISDIDSFIAGDYYVISVKDNGVGIKEEIIKKIFEPFFTTKDSNRGTGLGLAMVLNIITKHHGFIEVDSKENAGTTFKIYIPALKV